MPETVASIPGISRARELSIYASGLFSHSSRQISVVIIPLWALYLDLSPFLIGVVIGARSLLPIFLAIVGGTLIDRHGAKRVVIVCAVITVLLPALYPVLSWAGPLIALQLLAGASENFGLLGSHTLVGHHMKGSATHYGRLSCATFVGQFIGPPLIGFLWDVYGAWGAFIGTALWGALGLCAALALPGTAAPKIETTGDETQIRKRTRQTESEKHTSTLKLLFMGSVFVVLALTALRYGGIAMKGSFYIVYLEKNGITGTVVGLLVGAAGGFAAFSALLGGLAVRWMNARVVLFVSVGLTIWMICLTPMLNGITALFVAVAFHGIGAGISSAVSMSALSGLVPKEIQGRAFGLRMSVNRGVTALLPVLLGALVEIYGVEASFYIAFAISVFLIGLVAMITLQLHHQNVRGSRMPVQEERTAPQL